jgi:hypothetical protein
MSLLRSIAGGLRSLEPPGCASRRRDVTVCLGRRLSGAFDGNRENLRGVVASRRWKDDRVKPIALQYVGRGRMMATKEKK